MNANKNALGSDLARMDAHVIGMDEYDELPELTDADMQRGVWKIGERVVSEVEGRAATMAIHVHDYPQLHQLARQFAPDAMLSEHDAFSIYEREWPHVDQARLDAREKDFIRHLIATCGHGVFLVDGDCSCLSERTINAF